MPDSSAFGVGRVAVVPSAFLFFFLFILIHHYNHDRCLTPLIHTADSCHNARRREQNLWSVVRMKFACLYIYIYIYSIRGRDYFSLTLLPQFRRFLLVVCINSTICFQVLLCLIYIKKYQTMASYGGNTGNERFVSVGDLISQLSLLSNNSRKLGRKRL